LLSESHLKSQLSHPEAVDFRRPKGRVLGDHQRVLDACAAARADQGLKELSNWSQNTSDCLLGQGTTLQHSEGVCCGRVPVLRCSKINASTLRTRSTKAMHGTVAQLNSSSRLDYVLNDGNSCLCCRNHSSIPKYVCMLVMSELVSSTMDASLCTEQLRADHPFARTLLIPIYICRCNSSSMSSSNHKETVLIGLELPGQKRDVCVKTI